MKLTPITALLIAALCAGTAFAQPGMRGMNRKSIEKLNLTAEQEKSLRDIRNANEKQMIDLRASMQKKRIELGELRNAETPDRAAVERIFSEIGDLQLRQKMLAFDGEQAALKVLNPEQRKIWKEMKGERFRNAKDNRGRHRRGGAGGGGFGCNRNM